MIDLRIVRDNPDLVRDSQKTRGASPEAVDALLTADAEHRESLQRFEALRAEQKQQGKLVSRASGEEKAELLARTKELAAQVKTAEAGVTRAAERLRKTHMAIQNIVEDGVPQGGEDDYVVLRTVGETSTPEGGRDHVELAESLGMIDTERGAKTSGARFYYLTGVGALMQLAMLQLAMNKAVEYGLTPMIPPVLVRPEAMEGTGFLGEHADEVYYLERDDLYLVGTSEVPMASFHSKEILDLDEQPMRYAAWSSCFRREAGSYGKDTRGIIRVHQFDKIEMFSFCRPEDARQEHQRILAMEEEMLGLMGVPYRVIDTAGGDLGSSAARKFDCEAWLPSQNRYLELTSTSNCTTYQARRLGVRYRDENGRPQVAATLNGTLATTRWLVPILENNQLADGSVLVPEALRPFLGRDVLEPVR
ncbi:serine--tRNA ligase [Stackebrandtia soli]|uniref:serine--tRNA ligase n=1 Tax=Stackebrandtia soli TaxID=1892856 RepID=UPI0039E82D92